MGRVATVGLGLLVLGLASFAKAGDRDVGRTLLASARTALEKRHYPEAIKLLNKARAEVPDLGEVAYWLGVCHEKMGDTKAALAEYRAFRAVLDTAGGPQEKSENELWRKAQARIAILAPGETEEQKMLSQFTADLLAIAKPLETKDAAGAVLALTPLLQAAPEHALAREMHERLTAPPLLPGQIPLPAEVRQLTGWNDLIANRSFGTFANWIYEPPGIVVDTRQLDLSKAGVPIKPGPRFVLDLEVNVQTAHDPEWKLGWGLQTTSTRAVGIVLTRQRVAVLAGTLAGPYEVLADRALDPIQLDTWHRLTVEVDENRLRIWCDGKRPLRAAADGLDGDTQLALFHSRSRAFVRTLRWVPLP